MIVTIPNVVEYRSYRYHNYLDIEVTHLDGCGNGKPGPHSILHAAYDADAETWMLKRADAPADAIGPNPYPATGGHFVAMLDMFAGGPSGRRMLNRDLEV